MDHRIAYACLLSVFCLVQAGPSWSQSWAAGYDASLGTLPSAQGWTHVVSDPMPFDSLDEGNYLVSLGALTQGDTGGANADPANSQWYELPLRDIDFDAEVLDIRFRMAILSSTGHTPANAIPPAQPNAGFSIWLHDDDNANVKLYIGSGFVMLAEDSYLPDSVFTAFDADAGFADYHLRIDPERVTLDVNGTRLLTQIREHNPDSGRNLLRMGDLSNTNASSSQLEYIRLERSPVPAAAVRNYSFVSETISSGSATTASLNVSCPFGSHALGGGVETIGADGLVAIVESHPQDGAPPTRWHGKAREIVPTALDWELRVDVLCGELPGYEHLTQTLQTGSDAAHQSDALDCGPDASLVGGGAEIEGPELNQVLLESAPIGLGGFTAAATDYAAPVSSASWSVRAHATCSTAQGFEIVSASSNVDGLSDKSALVNCPSGKFPISGGARVVGDETNAALEISRPKDNSSPGELPVGWVAAAHGTSPNWYVSAYAVCAPISDPTVSKTGLLGRWRGDDAGHDAWSLRTGTPHNGVDYAPGLTGYAFSFDGTGDRWVEVPSSLPVELDEVPSDLYPEDSFTVEAWIQTDTPVTANSSTIVSLYDFGGTNNGGGTNQSYWAITLTPDGYASGVVRAYHGIGGIASVVDDVSLVDGQPHHIAMLRDKSIGRLLLYVDGRLVDDDTLITNGNADALRPGNPGDPDPVSIGAHRLASSSAIVNEFHGLIDDVKYYDRALTPREVADTAGCGVPVLPRVLNLDAATVGSPLDHDHGFCTYLEAGSYRLTLVSPDDDPDAEYSGWSPSANGAWGTEYHIRPEIDAGATTGVVPLLPSAQAAYDATVSKEVVLTFANDQRVDFSVADAFNLDNRGGVSVRLEAYVPEPGLVSMLSAGLAFLGLAGRSRGVRGRRESGRGA